MSYIVTQHRAPMEATPQLLAATDAIIKGLGNVESTHRDFFTNLLGLGGSETFREDFQRSIAPSLNVANAMAKAFRANTRADKLVPTEELVKAGFCSEEDYAKSEQSKYANLGGRGVIAKADLDVGTLTNFAQITGGQSLGYVSLDVQMARATTRPNSFTLYQALHKTAAFQVVDYWSVAQQTGGGLPGTAFTGFGNVASGTLVTSAGLYALSNITLKLAVNGRAITTALAAQNNFVDVSAQENINAALTVLESTNWVCYWGDPSLYPNQFVGLASGIGLVSGNTFDFQVFSNAYASANGWTAAQTLFNLIYQAAAKVTGYNKYGRITHAFMSPVCAGSLQGISTTLLNNLIAGLPPVGFNADPIVVNGDLQGMKTRFGAIQFPVDLYITARDVPAQCIVYENGTSAATLTAPTRPLAVSAALSGSASTNSAWTAAYVASSGYYSYAVASCDAAMNESTLTYMTAPSGASVLAISGITTTGAIVLTITGPGAADAAVFRVYRSGLGYQPASSGVANPASYRYIGSIAASGASAVTFNDNNTTIPGSETVFLLDMDENDMAVDYRFLLPLTRIELFAQNLYMPWAVASIGSIRMKIPKFNALVKNYVGDNPTFNPLSANANATAP